MRLAGRLALSLILFCFFQTLWADRPSPEWFIQKENGEVTLQVDLFLTSKCPHCQQADRFFTELAGKGNWLKVRRFWINQDQAVLETYHQYQQRLNINDFAVPIRTKIYRKLKAKIEIIDVDLGDILNKGKLETNVEIRPGDVVTIPERLF